MFVEIFQDSNEESQAIIGKRFQDFQEFDFHVSFYQHFLNQDNENFVTTLATPKSTIQILADKKLLSKNEKVVKQILRQLLS